MKEEELIEKMKNLICSNYWGFNPTETVYAMYCNNSEFKFEKTRSIYHSVAFATILDGKRYQVKYLPSDINNYRGNKGSRNIYFTYKETK